MSPRNPLMPSSTSFSSAMKGSHYLSNRGVSSTAKTIMFLQQQEEQSTFKTIQSSSLDITRSNIQSHFDYPLDEWQMESGIQIKSGNNVIVCAPTGAGKTVVGEIALRHAFEQGYNSIYTTPLKALSNQKFVELRQLFGPQNVGLSTGDMSINRNAPIMVMTTEVYRNMAWREDEIGGGGTGGTVASSSSSDLSTILNSPVLQTNKQSNQRGGGGSNNNESYLSNNAVVVLDEFHYMGQRGRGGVWEECVITCPSHTQLVALSATLPNSYQLQQWMESVTGRSTSLIDVSANQRPVPLRYLFATRDGLSPLFRDEDAGPGAPKGLLGLRGDGVVVPKETNERGISSNNRVIRGKKNNKKGFTTTNKPSNDENNSSSEYYSKNLPRGLTLHPDLQKNKSKLLTKVDRSLKRQEFIMIEKNGGYGESNKRRRQRREEDTTPFTSPKEQQRQRERLLRQEMRRSVPSLPYLIRRLDKQQLLPAIIFIFSRKGCDDAARTVADSMLSEEALAMTQQQQQKKIARRPQMKKKKERQLERKRQRKLKDESFDFYNDIMNDEEELTQLLSDANGRIFRDNGNLSEDAWVSIMEQSRERSSNIDTDNDDTDEEEDLLLLYAQQGLLSYDKVKNVAHKIQSFNDQNQEIAFDDATKQELLLGVGSHHAGQLAAHKTFVEALFRQQLLKVIFATETLAAGINVPARTTVITSLAKRGDGGSMNLLETSNLLQMAGRAGRRGMDTDGTCVILQTPFEGPEEAITILTNPILPITSQFAPSYTLAINLIQRGHGQLYVARELIQKSFAMWQKEQQQQQQVEQGDSKMQQTNENALFPSTEGKGQQLISPPLLQALAQEKFFSILKEVILDIIEGIQTQGDDGGSSITMTSNIEECLSILSNERSLKKASKSYVGLHQLLSLEESTLEYLKKERDEYITLSKELLDTTTLLDDDNDNKGTMNNKDEEDMADVMFQIQTQEKRIQTCQTDVVSHPLTSMAYVTNEILKDNTTNQKSIVLQSLLKICRTGATENDSKEENEDQVSTNIGDESDAVNNHHTDADVNALELAQFAKCFKILDRKREKLKKKKKTGQGNTSESAMLLRILNGNSSTDNIVNDYFGDGDNKSSLDDTNDDEDDDTTLDELKSLVNVLESFGCIVVHHQPLISSSTTGDNDNETNHSSSSSDKTTTAASTMAESNKEDTYYYSITPSGENISMLNFDNTLWALVAMGGAYDVQYQSKRLDEINRSLDDLILLDDDEDDQGNIRETNDEAETTTAQSIPDNNEVSATDATIPPEREVQELIEHLRDLSPSEMAGYISCLVSEGSSSRDGGEYGSIATFLNGLTLPQQKAIRSALLSGERLLEVQRLHEIDNTNDDDDTFGTNNLAISSSSSTNPCRLELSTCQVVTEWTAGCTWNEALELSGGLQPGDLARVLHRALDALRQFGALPYQPVRRSSGGGGGLHPDIRRLCRDAATAMDRYPLKDPLPLADDDDDDDENNEGDEEIMMTMSFEEDDMFEEDENLDETTTTTSAQ